MTASPWKRIKEEYYEVLDAIKRFGPQG